MAGDEYSIGGGKLKLKGSKVSGGRVEKKKKKSSSKKKEEGTQLKESTTDGPNEEREREESVRVRSEEREREESVRVRSEESDNEGEMPGKTAAERKAEEIRRKRVCGGIFFQISLLGAVTDFGYRCMSGFSGRVLRLIRSGWRS
jgi:protein FAM32A